MGERYRIGLLAATAIDPFSKALVRGAMAAAAELDVDLTVFLGRFLGLEEQNRRDEKQFDYQYNVLYDYAAQAGLDYIISATGSIAFSCDDRRKEEFLARFEGTPLLSLAAHIADFDFLQYNNRSGITQAVDYLARHGRSCIGMLAGSPFNPDCTERAAAYRESLERNGLTYAPSMEVCCDLNGDCHDEVRMLLDHNPTLDAILCANDVIASAVYDVLRERNIRIGSDMAVVGYDDLPFAAAMDPPLATVRADAEQLGRVALERAVNYLDGVEDDRHYLETSFLPRPSCFANTRFLLDPESVFIGAEGDVRKNIRTMVSNVSHSPAEAETLTRELFSLYRQLVEDYVSRPANELAVSQTDLYLKRILGERGSLYENTSRLIGIISGMFLWLMRSCHSESLRFVRRMYLQLERHADPRLVGWDLHEAWLSRTAAENIFVRDALMFGGNSKQSYAMILRRLCNLGAMSAFLYITEEPYERRPADPLPADLAWQFRSYCYGAEVYTVPEPIQPITPPEMYCNDLNELGRQHTFLASVLFTGETQYGLALIEPRNSEFLDELELVSYQLSSAVRTLDILRRQDQLLSEVYSRNLALEELSQVDALTGCANRRGFFLAADDMLNDPKYRGQPFLICYADMDNLKQVNDSYGHQEGDDAIRQVAECLRYALGRDAVIARMGGDEFAALLPDAKEFDIGRVTARKIQYLEHFNETAGKPFRFDISMGAVVRTCSGSYELKLAIDEADRMLYSEKRKKHSC